MQKVNCITQHLVSTELVAVQAGWVPWTSLKLWCHPGFTSSWRHGRMHLKHQAALYVALCSLCSLLSPGTLSSADLPAGSSRDEL